LSHVTRQHCNTISKTYFLNSHAKFHIFPALSLLHSYTWDVGDLGD